MTRIVVISLYMVSLENPENRNFKIVANAREAGTWNEIAHFNLHPIKDITIKFIRAFG